MPYCVVTFVATGLLESVSWNVIRNHLFVGLWVFCILTHYYSGRHPIGHWTHGLTTQNTIEHQQFILGLLDWLEAAVCSLYTKWKHKHIPKSKLVSTECVHSCTTIKLKTMKVKTVSLDCLCLKGAIIDRWHHNCTLLIR